MKSQSASDLMFKSVCFRLILGLVITLGVLSMILGIISNSVTCPHKQPCSNSFYYSTYECKEFGINYCCGSYYDSSMPSYSCGNFSYCYKNPSTSKLCPGLTITTSTFMGLTLILLIILLTIVCHFKGVVRRREKYGWYQAVVFQNNEELLRYQHAQNQQVVNNQYSINAQQPYYSNQHLLQEQERIHLQRNQDASQSAKGEMLSEK